MHRTTRPRLLSAVLAVAATTIAVGTAVGIGSAPSAGAVPSSGPGEYVALTPARILDTRDGTGAPQAPVAGRGTLALTVLGAAGVPSSGVASVVLNLTATRGAQPGYVSAYPANTTRPVASVLNFATGETRAHSVVVSPGASGAVTLFNGAQGVVDLVADVTGYYTAGTATAAGQFTSIAPARVLDTRTTNGGHHAPLKYNEGLNLQVAGRGGIPASGVSAVVLNLTATRPTAAGYLVANASTSSSVNFPAGGTVSNLAVVQLAPGGKILLDSRFGPTIWKDDVVADVFGYFRSGSPSAAGRLGAVRATRLLDTRVDPATGQPASHPIPAQGAITLQVAGRHAVPTTATAATVNVTIASPTSAGHLDVYPSGASRPLASTLNFATQTVANEVIATLGPDGAVTIYNASAQPQQVVVDLTAYVGAVPGALVWGAYHYFGADSDVTAVSCPGPSFCAVVDNDGTGAGTGRVRIWRGSTWTAPTALSPTPLQDVDCVSATYCVAVADHRSYEWDGTSWGHQATIPGPPTQPAQTDTRSLSCVSTTFCMVSGGYGDAPWTWTYNGSTWTSSDPGIPSDGRPTVSCSSATSCLAVGDDFVHWYGSVFDNGTWHALAPATTNVPVQDVSCAAATFCTAVGGTQGLTTASATLTFDGTSWGPNVEVPGRQVLTSVRCVAAAQCVGVAGYGAVGFGTGTSWTAPAGLDPAGSLYGLTAAPAVSCPTASFCVVTQRTGVVIGSAPTPG